MIGPEQFSPDFINREFGGDVEQFKKALTGGFPADKLGAYKYGILPTAAGMGEYLLNPKPYQLL